MTGRVTEDELCRSILKVAEPYEGSAFLTAPNLAVSCVHVCVRDDADHKLPHEVKFEYRPMPDAAAIPLHGCYLPKQSDLAHDLAVIRLVLPDGIRIPTAPMSLDTQAREDIVAFGFPCGQIYIRLVPGVIDPINYENEVRFEGDGSICRVLHIETKNKEIGNDHLVRSGMSGGPIWNKRTGTVVAVIEGRKPRVDEKDRGVVPPEGYGIPLKHLVACSSELAPLILKPMPQERSRRRITKVVLAIVASVLLASPLIWYPQERNEPVAAPLKLRTWFLKARKDNVSDKYRRASALRDADVLTAEDGYRVVFQADQAAFVYVLQRDSTGKVDVLFPNRQHAPQGNPVTAGAYIWVPSGVKEWFQLDEHVGKESILVVAAREPNLQLESGLHRLRAGGSQEGLDDWFHSRERGLGGTAQFETTPLPFPDGTIQELETPIVPGGDFAYKVEFQHR